MSVTKKLAAKNSKFQKGRALAKREAAEAKTVTVVAETGIGPVVLVNEPKGYHGEENLTSAQLIALAKSKLDAADAAKSVASMKRAEPTEPTKITAVVATTEIKNDKGIDVTRNERVSGKASNMIHGHSHTRFFMWAGANNWKVAEIENALKALNIPPVSINSIRTFYYAGRAGGDHHGRGDLPTYTAEQITQLESLRAPEPKATKKKAAKSK